MQQFAEIRTFQNSQNCNGWHLTLTALTFGNILSLVYQHLPLPAYVPKLKYLYSLVPNIGRGPKIYEWGLQGRLYLVRFTCKIATAHLLPHVFR